MPKVIKPNNLIASDEVVLIPDLALNQSFAVLDDNETFDEQADREPAETQEEISRRMLQAARAERDVLLEQARAQAEELRTKAHQEGLQAGLNEERTRIQNCVEQVEQIMDEMQERQRHYMERYGKELKNLALDIAEKILCKKIAEDTTELSELVRVAVSSIKNADWVSVEVSERLPKLVEWLDKELSSRAAGKQVDIEPRDLSAGTCILRTQQGVVDASISTQIENLRQVFQKMD